MIDFSSDIFLQDFIAWADHQPLVRAALITSTKAIPGGASDRLSDYDIILVLEDILPFHQSRDWLEAFGSVLVMFSDPLLSEFGHPTSGNVVQFEEGLKIDFTLWPVAVMQTVARQPALIPELDAGYQVLIDKDGLTAALPPPTYQAYIPQPPGEKEYQRIIEVFFLDVLYVAKYLWRGDLAAAKFILECDLMEEHLRPMLVWHVETEHGWTLKPGPHGRGLQKWLRSDLWAELMATYTGPDLAENWAALHRVVDLMRKSSKEVGERMGYAYPEAIDQRSVAYLRKIEQMEESA